MDNSCARFRAWDEIEKKMWFPIIRPDGRLMASNQMGGYVTFDDPQDPLMQYTGIKDKNGVEICQGDILKMPITGRVQKVEFHISGYDIKFVKVGLINGQAYDFGTESAKNLEVIGNIYQSPELLEE